jgi:hypothetical protein
MFEREWKRQMQQKRIRDAIAVAGPLNKRQKAAMRRKLRTEITVDFVESGVDTQYNIPEFVKFDDVVES